jgi:MFS family permease
VAEPLPPSVRRLGWTSLFTDAATEAVYPLLPLFVTRVLGGSALSLGVIEGAADAISSILKLAAGRLSDRSGRRKPLVVAGYAIAGAVRPLIALATTWLHVFAVRLADRVGKGLRSAPRDAMLSALAPAGTRGRVFGFHRAMDHAGAVVGPLAASAFLLGFPGEYRTLFALTLVPGILALLALSGVPEVPSRPAASATRRGPRESHERKALARPLKRFLVILAVFTLGNSTDAFLLLRLTDAGLLPAYLPLAWAGLHLVKSSLSTAGGALSDRLGRTQLIAAGWALYAVVYAGFAESVTLTWLLVWFALYGVYFALVEGSEKALVADLAPPQLQGTAFGWYNAVLGLGALTSSVLFGLLWETLGARAAFLTGAGLAVASAVLLVGDRELRLNA